jgi:RNA polymerase sigma-70 factor (ECF subfamily)
VDWPTVRGYLFTIVRHLFLKQRQAESRRAPLDADTIDDRPGPADLAQSHSELRVVLAALDQLPEIDRAAVLMRADDGLSYEEIAVALGISTAAAKVKVHRARLKLAAARLAIGPVARTQEQR